MIHDSFRSAQAAYDNMSPWDEDDCEGYYGIEAAIDAINAALDDGDLARIEAAVDMALDLIETRPHMHVSRRTDELEVCDYCEDQLRQLKRAVDAAKTWDLADASTCKHPPARLYSWFAADRTRCVACCDCGAVLAGAAAK